MSFLPAQYIWLQPVIVAAIIVFIIDLIGNTLTFSSRLGNALATAIVFFIAFAILVYLGLGGFNVASPLTGPLSIIPGAYGWLNPVLFGAIVVFIVGLLSNILSFSNRFGNALVTAILFAVIFGVLVNFGMGSVNATIEGVTPPAATTEQPAASGGTTN